MELFFDIGASLPSPLAQLAHFLIRTKYYTFSLFWSNICQIMWGKVLDET